MEFSKEELKELVLSSYELLIKIPRPEVNNYGKFEIKSRGKLKTLPDALKENSEDHAASIVHFIKSASYFIPRAEKSDRDEVAMFPFLDLLLSKVRDIENKEQNLEKVKEKIKYLVGYTNWNVDTVCTIFTASKTDEETKRRLQTMLGAELDIVDAKNHVEKIVSDIMKWKQIPNGEQKQVSNNEHRSYARY